MAVPPMVTAVGSPPRAWGQHRRMGLRCDHGRFTPTCVGTTCAWGWLILRQPVHPHVRGDNNCGSRMMRGIPGSPPRAWGQRRLHQLAGDGGRFTPTCVGTTSQTARIQASDAVHPHVRGDNLFFVGIKLALSGSPPRAWGQHAAEEQELCRARFTPTCVGTTGPVNQGWPRRPVHPHVRGDKDVYFTMEQFGNGSPPRAWGQPVRRVGAQDQRRFTPTCVGTTCPWLR